MEYRALPILDIPIQITLGVEMVKEINILYGSSGVSHIQPLPVWVTCIIIIMA